MTAIPLLSRAPSPTTVRRGGSAPAERAPSLRDPWPDNVRIVAAVLVVVCHALEPVLARSETATAIYWATWPARIPVFALVAGYFSDARQLDRRRSVALVRSVLGVYLAVDVLAFVRRGLVDDIWRYEPAVPAFGMWFLLSLFVWRLLLPVVVLVRWHGAVAVVAALGVGFFDEVGQGFSAARTVTFFPLFLLGWWLRSCGARQWWAAQDRGRHGWRVAAGAVLGATTVTLLVLAGSVPRKALRLLPYDGAWEEQVAQAGLRGLLLAVAAGGAVAVVLLVPSRRLPVVTYLGSGAMYVYVLHTLLVSQARSVRLFDHVSSAADLVVLVAGAVLVALVLASAPVRRATGWLVQPRGTWWVRGVSSGSAHAPAPAVGRPAEALAGTGGPASPG